MTMRFSVWCCHLLDISVYVRVTQQNCYDYNEQASSCSVQLNEKLRNSLKTNTTLCCKILKWINAGADVQLGWALSFACFTVLKLQHSGVILKSMVIGRKFLYSTDIFRKLRRHIVVCYNVVSKISFVIWRNNWGCAFCPPQCAFWPKPQNTARFRSTFHSSVVWYWLGISF